MKHQTMAEYLKERMMKMYEKKCPLCGDRLDPEEKCKCQIIKKLKEFMKDNRVVTIELPRTRFDIALVKQVMEQEIKIEDVEGKQWDIDIDSIIDVY